MPAARITTRTSVPKRCPPKSVLGDGVPSGQSRFRQLFAAMGAHRGRAAAAVPRKKTGSGGASLKGVRTQIPTRRCWVPRQVLSLSSLSGKPGRLCDPHTFSVIRDTVSNLCKTLSPKAQGPPNLHGLPLSTRPWRRSSIKLTSPSHPNYKPPYPKVPRCEQMGNTRLGMGGGGRANIRCVN